MSSISGWKERAARMNGYIDENLIISDRKYNLVMGAVVFYGLFVNFILCSTVGSALYYAVNPILFLIFYFVCCLAGISIAKNSDNALISFLGYNLVVLPIGLVVSACVEGYGGISSAVVGTAFYYTMLITAIMVVASALFPQAFANLGGVLFSCLIGLLFCGILMFFIPSMSNVYSYIAAVIFSLYIGYDYYRAQQFPKTVDNAVDCALDIYLDIINLFLQLLRIFGRGSSSSGRRGGR